MNFTIVELQLLLYLVRLFYQTSPLKNDDDVLVGFPFGNFRKKDCLSFIEKIENAIDYCKE